MELIEKIIALLEAKFSGVRKDAIQSLASSISLQVEDEAGAQTIVDRMTAEKVNQFVTSYRSRIDKEIQQSNQAYEQTLRKKFDFSEKNPGGNPKPGELTIEAIQAAIKAQLEPMQQRMDAYEVQKLGATRRESYVAKLKDAKISQAAQDTLIRQFDRMTFADDADFNQFLADSQTSISKLAQEESNQRMRSDFSPSFANVDDKGVSQAMKDYQAAKSQENNKFEGKTL